MVNGILRFFVCQNTMRMLRFSAMALAFCKHFILYHPCFVAHILTVQEEVVLVDQLVDQLVDMAMAHQTLHHINNQLPFLDLGAREA